MGEEADTSEDTPKLDLEAAGAEPLPTLEDVRRWEGVVIEDIDGAGVGRISGCFVDSGSGEPAWLLIKLGRFGSTIAVPMHDTAVLGSRGWTPYHRDILRDAPIVDSTRPLNREQELALCEYYGLGESHGRAGQVRPRDEGEITANPPASDAPD